MTEAYAELHAHSGFSFLDGSSDPEELVAEADRLGLAALALTDHHGFYGVVRFAEAARASVLAEAHLAGGEKGRPVFTLAALASAAAGHWLVLTGCRKGAVPAALMA